MFKNGFIVNSKISFTMEQIQNRGTGAGGSNTNASGLPFEEKTSNEQRLLDNGFMKKSIDKTNYYLTKTFENGKELIYVKQRGLRKYLEKFLGKTTCFNPDEAYLWKNGDAYTLRVVEKKNQNVPGSVIEKLQTGNFKKRKYEKELGIEVNYAYCMSAYLKKQYLSPEWKYDREIFEEDSVHVLFGDDEDYFTCLDEWIYS